MGWKYKHIGKVKINVEYLRRWWSSSWSNSASVRGQLGLGSSWHGALGQSRTNLEPGANHSKTELVLAANWSGTDLATGATSVLDQ